MMHSRPIPNGGPPWMSITFLLVVVIPGIILIIFCFYCILTVCGGGTISVRSLVEGSGDGECRSWPNRYAGVVAGRKRRDKLH